MKSSIQSCRVNLPCSLSLQSSLCATSLLLKFFIQYHLIDFTNDHRLQELLFKCTIFHYYSLTFDFKIAMKNFRGPSRNDGNLVFFCFELLNFKSHLAALNLQFTRIFLFTIRLHLFIYKLKLFLLLLLVAFCRYFNFCEQRTIFLAKLFMLNSSRHLAVKYCKVLTAF